MNIILDDVHEARFITMSIHNSIDEYINNNGSAVDCAVFITTELIEYLNAYLTDAVRVFPRTNISSIWGVPVIPIQMPGKRYWIAKETCF